MKTFERYFERNGIICLPDFSNNPEVIVIIPVFNDQDIFATLDSLCHCTCDQGNIGVIVIVNHGINCLQEVKEANYRLSKALRQYIEDRNPGAICFCLIEAFDLPAKFAGVGLARKMAMDIAAYWFFQHDKLECPILSLDADTYVEENYTDETISFFRRHRIAGASLAYAHRLEESECCKEMREAIINYELYLRYYQQALAYAGHPHAFHCIGSAFAVRASDYIAQGGMNKRQAGEDFYFLQKLIATGRYATLKQTKVYPSPRFSNRTPFGTGQVVQQIVKQNGNFPVYHFEAFKVLKLFFEGIPILYKAEEDKIMDYFLQQGSGIRSFLFEINGPAILAEVNANCASPFQFMRRFYEHFNAFRVLKYLNYMHENQYAKVDIQEALKNLFHALRYPWSADPLENLTFLRER